MPKASVVIYMMPRSDKRILEIDIPDDQVIDPRTVRKGMLRGLTRAEVEAEINALRTAGYAVEWRIGGYLE